MTILFLPPFPLNVVSIKLDKLLIYFPHVRFINLSQELHPSSYIKAKRMNMEKLCLIQLFAMFVVERIVVVRKWRGCGRKLRDRERVDYMRKFICGGNEARIQKLIYILKVYFIPHLSLRLLFTLSFSNKTRKVWRFYQRRKAQEKQLLQRFIRTNDVNTSDWWLQNLLY